MTGAGTQPPGAQGLYDPQHEHDACGVGFVVAPQGPALARDRRAGPRAADQPRAPRRLRLRGQHRRRRRHPDPDAGPLPAQGHRRRSAFTLPAEGDYGAGLVFLPRDAARARDDRVARSTRIVERGGPDVLGWRDVPTDDSPLGDARASASSRSSSRSSSARGRRSPPTAIRGDRSRFERKLYVIRKRIEHAGRRARRSPSSTSFYVVSLSARTLIYKGMLTADQLAPIFPDLRDPDVRVGARARAPALQHQHVPVLAARAPVPLHRAQRRDQHAARQHQLDARARGRCCQSALFGDDLAEAPADHPRGRQRHGDLRQRARVPRHERAARCRTRC